MSSTATKKVGMGIASTIIKSLSPPLTPFTHAYRVPLKRDFPKHWKQPNTSVRLDKLPLLPMLPSTHADLPMRHDSLTMNRKISGGQPKPWKYYAFVGDRCCSVYAAVILQKSACDNRIRSVSPKSATKQDVIVLKALHVPSKLLQRWLQMLSTRE